jgi:LL-diaminopimelate aminotransferase
MKILPAKTVETIKPYYFSTLNKTLAELKAQGKDVIRLDMGSPDLPPAQFIIDQLIESARNPKKHGYSPLGGSAEFLCAVSSYYQNRFGVAIDPKSEALALIGSKEGIFNIHHTLLDPGDLVLMPDPYYPVYMAGAELASARVHFMPLRKENAFLPDFDAIPAEVAQQAKMMWLNYPNNPTGAVADLNFFQKAVDFAMRHEIIIVHDAPYVDVTFDGYLAHSILEVPGAKEVAVEFNSLSKTYNMAGWRIGMAVGNADVVRYLATYKSQMDSSIFAPIMDAGTVALTGDQSWLVERNQIYQERRDVVYEGLIAAGFDVEKPKAALYLWVRLPEKYHDAAQFCSDVLQEAGVSLTPGEIYGPQGEDYFRISIITPTEQIKEAMRRLVAWVDSH